MIIEPFCSEDIAPFLKLAAEEGWVAEPWEFKLLLAEFPQGCFAARGDKGEMIGFVTSLRHLRSGWIGNLIVAQQFRGRGVGQELFGNALEALHVAGAQTIWLTASKSGMPLYEKHGFSRIDTIFRWVGTGRQRHGGQGWNMQHGNSLHPAFGHLLHHGEGTSGRSVLFMEKSALSVSSQNLDTAIWGDRREVLLAVISCRGKLLQNESGFIVRQPCGESVQFGPFASLDTRNAVRLFDEALGKVAAGTRIFLDVPRSNRGASRLLHRRGMRVCGSNELMYAGTQPDYRPGLLYGLATMGSCG